MRTESTTILSKREFLRMLFLALSQIVIACVYRKANPDEVPKTPTPTPPFQPKTAFLTDLGGQTLIGDDEIKLEWSSTDSFPLLLQFSVDEGNNWSNIATIPNNEPYIWTVPQINNDKFMLKLTGSGSETVTSSFKIQISQVILISQHTVLEQTGGFKQFEFPDFENVVVKNIGVGFSCTSLTCTHSGCTTEYSGSEFNCSCHGSRFDEQGTVLNGPANRPLKKYQTKYLNTNKKLLIV